MPMIWIPGQTAIPITDYFLSTIPEHHLNFTKCCVFNSDAIQLTDHYLIGQIPIIWIPDESVIYIPTILPCCTKPAVLECFFVEFDRTRTFHRRLGTAFPEDSASALQLWQLSSPLEVAVAADREVQPGQWVRLQTRRGGKLLLRRRSCDAWLETWILQPRGFRTRKFQRDLISQKRATPTKKSKKKLFSKLTMKQKL